MPRLQVPFLLLMCLVFCSESPASFEHRDQGCEYLSAGSSGIALRNTSFAVFNNPAKILLLENANINLFYRNYYGLKEINQISLANHFHLYSLPMGLGITTYGNKLYRETELRTAMAFKLIQQIQIGVSFNLYYLDIKNYGTAMSWGFDLALMKDISDYVSMAFVVSNLNEPKIGSSAERIPTHFTFGLAYQPLQNTALCFDIVKDDQFDFDYRFGVQYNLNSWLSFMCGFRDMVNSFSAGLKISNDNYILNYAFQYHPDLGGSNSMSVGYAF